MKKLNGWLEILIFLIIALLSLAVAWGAFSQKVNNNYRRIEKVEVKVDKNEDAIARVEERVIYIADTVKEIKEEVKK